MSTLSLRKIKHDNSAVDNITLDSNGNVGINKTTPRATGGFNSLSLNGTDGSEIWFDAGNTAATRLSGTASETRITAQASGSVITMFTGATERLRVDNSGRVTMPYQPAFSVNGASFTGLSFIGTNVSVNVGSHFSTTTGRFTAPITGTYLFSFVLTTQNTESHFVDLTKNGSTFGYHFLQYGPSYTTGSNIQLIQLNASDYVEARKRDASYSVYNAAFSGFLIG